MPIHDRGRREAWLFHHFRHAWIEAIARALNGGLLPADSFAMVERRDDGPGPSSIAIRHVGGDRVVAMVEVVSPGTKSSRQGLQTFVRKDDRPLTLVAYESSTAVRAFVEPIAVGEGLPEMPVFLVPGGHVPLPTGAAYDAAVAAVPRRWRGVPEAAG